MPMLRISAETHARLIRLKRGLDTFDDVLQRLLRPAEEYQRILEGYHNAGSAVEADAKTDR